MHGQPHIRFTLVCLRGICGGQIKCERERELSVLYRSLPVSIVQPKLTCHRLSMNHAIKKLTRLFHSCVAPNCILCLQFVRLLKVSHRASEHGDDDHDDDSKHNLHGAPQSQSPHSLCPHTHTVCVPTTSSQAPQHLTSRRKSKGSSRCNKALKGYDDLGKSIWW